MLFIYEGRLSSILKSFNWFWNFVYLNSDCFGFIGDFVVINYKLKTPAFKFKVGI